jgi:hypothetical protein
MQSVLGKSDDEIGHRRKISPVRPDGDAAVGTIVFRFVQFEDIESTVAKNGNGQKSFFLFGPYRDTHQQQGLSFVFGHPGIEHADHLETVIERFDVLGRYERFL